jgi:hypothetical protein
MIDAIPIVEASVATVNIASEMTSRRIRHRAETSGNLRISKGSKQEGVGVTFCGWDFRSKSVNGAVKPLK